MELYNRTPRDLADGLVGAVSRHQVPAGSPDYCRAVLLGLRNLWPFLEANWATFDRELALLREHQAWNILPTPEAPYGSEDVMLRAEIGAGLREVMLRLSRAQQDALSSAPPKTHQEAGALGGRGNKARNNCNGLSRGNRSIYLAGLLERDHPAIHARLAAGEFRSVRAAAIEAGIVTPRPRLSIPLDDLDAAGALLRRRLAPAQLTQLIGALSREEHA